MADTKVLLLGESGSGKTSLIRFRVFHMFNDDLEPTMPINYFKQETQLKQKTGDPIDFTLNIWDTAGQERYYSLTASFFRMTNVALLVGDITSRSSMERIFSNWLIELRRNVPSVKIFVAANKWDSVSQTCPAAMTEEELTKLCKDNGILGWEYTSAKTGHNVDKIFNILALTAAVDSGIIAAKDCTGLKYWLSTEKMIDDTIDIPLGLFDKLKTIGEQPRQEEDTSEPPSVDLSKRKEKHKDACCG